MSQPNKPPFTPEQQAELDKLTAYVTRSSFELGCRLEVTMEQLSKLLCDKNASSEKQRAVLDEIQAEAQRRIAKRVIDLDRVRGDFSVLVDEICNSQKPPLPL